MKYREYLSKLLYSSYARKMAGVFIFGTSYDLFTEYGSESATAKSYTRLIMDFSSQVEIEFYVMMDYLTFIPFGEAGRRALVKRNIDAAALKFDKSLRILRDSEIDLSADEQLRLKAFFDGYGENVHPVSAVGYATVARKISDRLINMIVMGKCGGSIGKSKLLKPTLRKIIDEIYDLELKEYNDEAILGEFPDMQSLDEAQTDFLDEALDALQ